MDTKKFSCCKQKDFNNGICVGCFAVFHSSCIERKSDVIKLSGNRIYCSLACQEKFELQKDREEALLKNIELLRTDNLEKDQYISRLRRNSQGYMDMVQETEEHYIDEIAEQKKIITDLKEKLSQLRNENAELMENVKAFEEKVANLSTEVQELNSLNRNMVSSIRVLESENRDNLMKLSVLERENLVTKNSERIGGSVGMGEADDGTDSELHQRCPGGKNSAQSCKRADKCVDKSFQNRGRLLLLCDETGYSFKNQLLRSVGNNFRMETIIKPNACFGEVIDSVVGLSHDYTLRDFIIILGGCNDLKNGKYPSFKEINSRVKLCTHTNIIFLTLPYFKQERYLNTNVHKFNLKLEEYSSRLNKYAEGKVALVDINNKKRLLKRGKVELINEIIAVINSKKQNSNLIFVNCINIEHTLSNPSSLAGSFLEKNPLVTNVALQKVVLKMKSYPCYY